MKNLKEILFHLAEVQLDKSSMKQIKGGALAGDSCKAECPGKTPDSVTCSCAAGVSCSAYDGYHCVCASISGEKKLCA